MRTSAATGLVLACLIAGCGNETPAPAPSSTIPVTAPEGVPSQAELVSIDGGPAAGAASYKGLPLGLTHSGEPAVTPVDGVIGLVCIGMSNGNQECADFIQQIDAGRMAGAINPAVRVVNCAVGGHAIERWIDPAFDSVLWEACLGARVRQRGVRADQVRVIWHKAARQFTTDASGAVLPPYPDPSSDYFLFQQNLSRFADVLRQRMPSVQAVYTSGRSYGGFALSPGRGEPLSYEEGQALNQWLASNGSRGGIWFGWGPYLWAPDCASGRTNGSGVCYNRDDYKADGVHPAAGALDKITWLLHGRFSQDDWYRP